MSLTSKQESLLNCIESELRKETALEYVKLGYKEGPKAYLSACKNIKRKPSKNPDTSAAEILNYPSVIAFINSIKIQVAEVVQINAAYVLNRLVEIDQLDILDIVKDDMSGFKLLSEWPKPWRVSISALDMKKMITTVGDNEDLETIVEKIKWPDKTKNLELIGKHVTVKAWDKEQQVINNNNIMPVPTADSVDDWEKQAKAHQDRVLKDV